MAISGGKPLTGNWYDFAEWYDIAFQGDTKLEADFVFNGCQQLQGAPPRRVFEPGCGTARLLIELAKRGVSGVGVDRNVHAIAFANKAIAANRLGRLVRVVQGNMASFSPPQLVDAAFCFCNTFRSLLTEDAARGHLETVAKGLRPGGLYFLGLHLLPPDADWESHERWTETRGECKVTVTLRVLESQPRLRLETLRFSLSVDRAGVKTKVRSEETLRTYSAAQFKKLLRSVKALQLVAVRDFWYDWEWPLELSDEIADTVVVLRKR